MGQRRDGRSETTNTYHELNTLLPNARKPTAQPAGRAAFEKAQSLGWLY
jgi:hypothetical protein